MIGRKGRKIQDFSWPGRSRVRVRLIGMDTREGKHPAKGSGPLLVIERSTEGLSFQAGCQSSPRGVFSLIDLPPCDDGRLRGAQIGNGPGVSHRPALPGVHERKAIEVLDGR